MHRKLDVPLALVRETGTFNVLLEFLEYDRSIVLGDLGDTAGAQASYRRYITLYSGDIGNTSALCVSKVPRMECCAVTSDWLQAYSMRREKAPVEILAERDHRLICLLAADISHHDDPEIAT